MPLFQSFTLPARTGMKGEAPGAELRLRESLLAILGTTWRKKWGMVMRQPQTMPEAISAILALMWGQFMQVVGARGKVKAHVHIATGNR